MITQIEGTVEVQRNTLLATYRGLMVLRTILKRNKLSIGQDVTEQLLKELAEAMPELPALTALRDVR